MKRISFALFLFSLISFAKSPNPKLIVFISVDQMRPDYFERYGHLFTGGLKRLYSKGIVYTNADLNYASSETGPGHATLGTGCFPHKSGIHANEWIDPMTRKSVYCVEDSLALPVENFGGGYSPKNVTVNGIGDWLKAGSKKSKVVAISSKDRAAILMGGKNPDYAFWYYAKSGRMVTSSYYVSKLPQWANDFNSSGWIEKNVPDAWTKKLPDSVYEKIGPDEFIAEPKRNGSSSFPYAFTAEKKSDQMMGTPYGDFFVLDFSLAAVRAEKLGKRNVTDLLCVSLSNCDYVGHSYGPDSHEMLDFLVRLDERLGEFFSEIDSFVGKDNYIVALSADHAVCPLPEFNSQFRGINAKRYNYANEVKGKIDSLNEALKSELKTTENVITHNAFINYPVALAAGLDSANIERRVKDGLLSIEAIVDIYFRRDMLSSAASNQPFIQKYRNSYFDTRGEDFQYRIREYCLISSRPTGTTHGSPYEYDTHIPLLFWWNKATPQKISREVHSADAAPTLAKFAGFSFPKNLDGVPLKEVAR